MVAAPPMPAAPQMPQGFGGPAPARPDAGRPDQSWSEFNRGDYGRTEQVRPEQVRPDQGWPDQGQSARPDMGRPDMGRPDMGRPDFGRPAPGRPDAPMQPTGGWPYVGTPAAPPPAPPAKSRKGLFIALAVLIGLVLLGGAAAIGYLVMNGSDDFAVGTCVRQDGSGASVVECSESGAFKVVSRVQSVDLCPDPAQPAIVLKSLGKSDEVICLQPAATG
jgi:hypothetical protein